MMRAFTLIELMVVLAIIAGLAGISVPVIGIVRRQSKDVQCRHHLQQLFTGIASYRTDQQQAFPPSLTALFENGNSLQGTSSKLVWCPHDATHGDPFFHRNPEWGSISLPGGTSYLFEVANQELNATERAWPADATTRWEDHGSTWAEFKTWQLRHGNNGGAYPENGFPIARCFFHFDWAGKPASDGTKGVVNLAWDGAIFLSIPKWEDAY